MLRHIDFTSFYNQSDGAVINYIHTALKNKYITLSKMKRKYEKDFILFGEANELENLSNYSSFATDHYLELEKDFLKDCLTENEYSIIFLFFYCKYSVNEIAIRLNVSRQAVNQAKLRAIEKLRKAYFIKSN